MRRAGIQINYFKIKYGFLMFQARVLLLPKAAITCVAREPGTLKNLYFFIIYINYYGSHLFKIKDVGLSIIYQAGNSKFQICNKHS